MVNNSPSVFSKAFVIAGVSLVLGLLFDYLFEGKASGISFPLYIALAVTGLFIIGAVYSRPLERKNYWIFVPIAFFSSMVFVRDSGLLTIMNVGASFLLLLLLARISFARSIKSLLLKDYIKVCFLPFATIKPFFQTVGDLVSLRGISKDKNVTAQIVKGIIMTVPVLIVFVLLFSSADLVFHKYLLDLINIKIDTETIVRAFCICASAGIFMGAYAYLFRKSEEPSLVQTTTNAKIGNIETAILLFSVNLLFLAFIYLQITYLFGSHDTIVIEGVTYASYAHQGFFQLIAVAVISFFLLLAAEKYIVKKEGSHGVLFKLLSTALIAQVLMIMASAFMRLALYEEAYGFTTLRLYSHAFIIFLALVFCILLYKIYIDSRENMLAFRIFITVIAFAAAMNGLNPDAFIARKNVERFIATGKLDEYYMAYLSADAIPESIKILDLPDSEKKLEFMSTLSYSAQYMNDPQRNNQWQSTHLSRMTANQILQAKASILPPPQSSVYSD